MRPKAFTCHFTSLAYPQGVLTSHLTIIPNIAVSLSCPPLRVSHLSESKPGKPFFFRSLHPLLQSNPCSAFKELLHSNISLHRGFKVYHGADSFRKRFALLHSNDCIGFVFEVDSDHEFSLIAFFVEL